MDEQTLHWLAGLLEGDGSFQKPAPSQPQCPRITIQMTDKDVIERVAELFGRKYIYARRYKTEHWKTNYSTLIKSRKAVELMRKLYPLMGARRKTQIENAIGERPEIIVQPLEDHSLYWLAGLLEAEGSL